MKRFLYASISLAFLISGCASMPEQINEKYMAEKTADETASLEKLEDSIIAKKHDKDEAVKADKVSDESIKKAEAKISIAESEEKFLVEKLNLYTLNNDTANIDDTKAKLAENKKSKDLANAEFNFASKTKENTSAIIKLNDAELSTLVAQRNYERALIAKKYQEKHPESVKPEGEQKEESGITNIFGKKEDNTVDVVKYKEYLDKQKKNLMDLQNEQKKAENDMNNAKAALDKLSAGRE